MAISKLDRFTQHARRVLALAQAAATGMQHNQIDTGHILIGFLDEGTGVAANVLHDLGLDFRRASELVGTMTPEALKSPGEHLELSPGTKKILELAVEEAQRLDHFSIGTGPMLLGLVGLNSGIAVDVLLRLGITPDEVRQRIINILDPTQPSFHTEPLSSTQHEEVLQAAGDRVVVQKMERFTQRARRVLSLAQEEAERLQHSSIGTEHLLLGLMREEGGIAGRVLRDLGLDQRRVEELVERMTRAGQRSSSSKLDLSPGTKKVLELAVDEARRMGHHYIGTEHLLLGLVRQSEGIAIEVFKRLNVAPEEVRRQTRRVLQENPVQPPGQPAAALRIQQPTPPEPSTHYAGHILGQARKEARILGHQFVGIWHLLLALLGSDDVAEQILRELGLDEQRIESMMNALPDRATDDKELAVTVRAEAILRYASTAAASLGSTYVGSEHILRAFLYNDEEIFKLLKISPDDVRRLLQEHEARLRPPEPAAIATAKSAQARPATVRFGMTTWKSVGLAIDAAISLGSHSVGLWHLLLGLLQSDSFAGQLLREVGIEPQRILEKIRVIAEPQRLPTIHRESTKGPELSADVVEILRRASEESKAEARTPTDDEYLLLVMLHEHRDIFEALAIDPESILSRMEQLVKPIEVVASRVSVTYTPTDSLSQQTALTTSTEGNYMDEKDIYRALAEAEKSGQPVALATVVRTVGSMPRHAGSKLLIYADGRTVGTVGGGAMEARVVEEAKAAIKDGKPRINTYTLNDLKAGDPGVCGGTADIFIDPLFVRPTLVVIGCGHVGKALAELAKWAGFRVIVSDDRGELCNPQHIPNMDGYIVTPPNAAHQHIDLGPNTYVAALTRGLPIDLDLFPPLLQANVPYLGLIGSRRRWALTIKELEARGFTKEQLARVRAPIGLELEAETPKEIAVSILAEIIMLRNGGTGQPMQWMGSTESAAE